MTLPKQIFVFISLFSTILVTFTIVVQALEFEGEFIEGSMIIGRVPITNTVTVEGRKLRVTDEGFFVFGLGYGSREIEISIVDTDGQTQFYKYKVSQRVYKTQRIDGLPPEKVNPSEKILKRIKAEQRLVAKARDKASPRTYFIEGFIWPALGKISGVYGSKRILNGESRQPHFGIDIAAPVGWPVISPAGGIVTLAENDLYFSGGTLIIDHGHGISSSFLHLSKLKVNVGQHVKKGQEIGSIGATGRVTGPHLDWRINWFNQRLDPALIVGSMPIESIPPPPMRP